VVRDFRFISELGIDKRVFNNWKIGAETTLKLEKNATRIDEVDLDMNVAYSPIDFLDLAIGYRIAFNHKRDGTYERKYRYLGEMEFDRDIKRFKLEYRFRYQNIDDDFFQREQQPAKNILRNRVQVSYNIRKSPIEPFTSYELYSALKVHRELFSKFKFLLGIKYSPDKLGTLKLYYRIDRELNELYPYSFYVLGIGYTKKF
jgi:hypothetical protein